MQRGIWHRFYTGIGYGNGFRTHGTHKKHFPDIWNVVLCNVVFNIYLNGFKAKKPAPKKNP